MDTLVKTHRPLILVLEDDMLLALDMEDHLTAYGYDVSGPYGRVSQALAAIPELNLAGAIVDLIGYLSYSNRHADLLFELISRRYEKRSTIVITNKPFAQWSEVFPNAACVVSLVDGLVHHCAVVAIEGVSYRFKEANERSIAQRQQRVGHQTGEKEPTP